MKINSKNVKKHAREIKDITEAELLLFKDEYQKMMGSVNTMSSAGLLILSLTGIFIILFFSNMFFDFIGILVFAYPFYLFVKKESHEEGFCEGRYYHAAAKDKKEDDGLSQEKGEKERNKKEDKN